MEKDIISKVRFHVFKHKSFYADISLMLNHIYTTDVPIMACDLKTIYINPEAIKEFTFDEVLFAYIHEVRHIILCHHLMFKKFSDNDHFLMNIATDILVNELNRDELGASIRFQDMLIFKEGFPELSDENVKKLSSIEIFNILSKRFNKMLNKVPIPQVGKGNGSSSGNEILGDFKEKFDEFSKKLDEIGKNGEISGTEKNVMKQAFPDHYFKKKFDNLDDKTKKDITNKIKEGVMNGYVRAKARGTLTKSEETMMNHLFKKVRNWKKHLRETVLDTIRGDYTWAKPSDILQSLHSAGYAQIGNIPSLNDSFTVSKIQIGIDVSGSISTEDYKNFLNEIYSIFKSVNVRDFEIVMWEGEVTGTFKSRNGFKDEILSFLKKRKGYGGTCLRSFITYCEKRARNTIAIIFTDGCVEGDLTQKDFRVFKEVVFVLTKDCDYGSIAKLKSGRIKVLKMD